MTREELLKILWSRICDETKSHNSVTLRYVSLINQMMEWEKPDAYDGSNANIIVRIGECEECKKAGRPTSHFNSKRVPITD